MAITQLTEPGQRLKYTADAQLRTLEELQGQRMTGAQITCAAIEAEGTRIVFGYPGGALSHSTMQFRPPISITFWSDLSSGPLSLLMDMPE